MFVASSIWCVYYSRRVIDGNWSLYREEDEMNLGELEEEENDVRKTRINPLDDGYNLKGPFSPRNFFYHTDLRVVGRTNMVCYNLIFKGFHRIDGNPFYRCVSDNSLTKRYCERGEISRRLEVCLWARVAGSDRIPAKPSFILYSFAYNIRSLINIVDVQN